MKDFYVSLTCICLYLSQVLKWKKYIFCIHCDLYNIPAHRAITMTLSFLCGHICKKI